MIVAVTPEPTAELDPRERLLLNEQLSWLFPFMLAMDAIIIATMIVAGIKSPEFNQWWVWACMAVVVLLFALLTLHARDERSLLRQDLKRGVKALRGGVIDAKHKIEDEDSAQPTYRIHIAVGNSESPLGFTVPQAIYDAIEPGQSVRIAYAPGSLFLFELSNERGRYLVADETSIRADPPPDRPGKPD